MSSERPRHTSLSSPTCLHPAAVREARTRLQQTPSAVNVAGLFATLGDTTRLRILRALGPDELCVCDLAAATGINRSTVSHQLRVLRDSDLVRRRREGKTIYYRVADDHVATLLHMGAAHAGHDAAVGEEVA